MKPLTGVKVLDLTHALAGPFCTYHLQLLGADVIKVERPGVGDDFRHYVEHGGAASLSAPFIAVNAGKRSITLNLKSPDGMAVLHKLIKECDVIVENFRPGVPAKLGIDWPGVEKINPRMIYCSITGFGQIGDVRNWPAYDHIVQAMSGIAMINGEEDQGPLKVGIPLSDTFSGYVASYSILAALLQRAQTGVGQNIDVAMLDATFVLMSSAIAGFTINGQMPRRTGNRGFRLIATSDTYKTADGYIAIGANHQHQFEHMCRAMGVENLLDDPRFATHDARMANNDALYETLTEVFATLSAEELEPKLAASQVPASRVRDISQSSALPHLQDRNLFVEAEIPGQDAPARIVGSGFMFGHDNPGLEGPVPTIGEHTDEILGEMGYSLADIAALRSADAI